MPDRVVFEDRIAEGPLSPWVRLAHVYPYGSHPYGLAFIRTITDHELILQLEGDSWIWVEALGGHIRIHTGDILLIPPGLVHGLAQTRHAVELAVHFDLVARPGLVSPDMCRYQVGRLVGPGPPASRMLWTRMRRGPSSMLFPLVSRLPDFTRWRERLLPLAQAQLSHALRDLTVEITAAATIAWALSELAHAGPSAAGPATARARVQAVLAELTQMGKGPVPTIPELAARARLGESAFRIQVQALTGATPRVHLENLRLEQAARLLTETCQPVTDIALTTGYADPFHFSRVFRRCFGSSPRAFRLASALSPQSRVRGAKQK